MAISENMQSSYDKVVKYKKEHPEVSFFAAAKKMNVAPSYFYTAKQLIEAKKPESNNGSRMIALVGSPSDVIGALRDIEL